MSINSRYLENKQVVKKSKIKNRDGYTEDIENFIVQ